MALSNDLSLPWRNAGAVFNDGIVYDSRGWLVATVNLANPHARTAKTDLFAAAPDLLAAAIKLLAYHGAGAEGDELDQRLISDLRAAVAKASGETP